MTMSKIKLMGALGALTVVGVMGQSSCVQLNATDFSSCPCEDATLTFTLEGETTVAANTVSKRVLSYSVGLWVVTRSASRSIVTVETVVIGSCTAERIL